MACAGLSARLSKGRSQFWLSADLQSLLLCSILGLTVLKTGLMSILARPDRSRSQVIPRTLDSDRIL